MSDTKEVIKQKYFNHINELNKIDTTEFRVLKCAMKKYEEQTNKENYYGYIYDNKWKYKLRYCAGALEIQKMNTRYVCSAERLDAIDFNIIYDYTNKTSMYDRGED